MAETLGEAVLALRTDDSAFTTGVNKAQAAATGLGRTLDVASSSSVALADKMTRAIAPIEGVTRASSAQRQGMFQLTQQLGDMSTMYALGMRPQQIFASQIGQVTGAVTLLAGEGSKFARFLGGPWGVAVMLAVQVLGPLAGALFQTNAAMQKVELASNALGDAQGVLGQMFDLATGKIKSQNEMLRLNAQLMAINLRAEATKKEASSTNVLGGAARGDFSKLDAIGMGLRFAGEGEVQQVQNRINTLQGWVKQYRDGTLSGNEVVKLSESMSFDGLSTTMQEFQQAIADDFTAKSNRKVADAIETSISSDKLDPMFLRPDAKKKSKTKSGKTQAEIDAEFLQGVTTLNREELQARLELATDAGVRLDIQKELLEAEREDKIRAIEANKGFSAAQRQAQIAIINRLYGRPGQVAPNGDIISEGSPGLLNQQSMRQFEAEQTRLANDMLQRQAETAQAWAQVTPSVKERARLEAEALRLQQQIQTNLLEQQIATGQVADAEKARAELRSQQGAAQAGLAQRSAGPLASYVAGLRGNQADTELRVEALMVQELDWVHQSIARSISDRLGVKDPFLAGLIEMFVEDVLIRPFAEALQGARGGGLGGGGGGGGLFGSLLGSIFGGSLGGGASPLGRLAGSVQATIGDPQFAGLFADGGTIPMGSWGIVGEAGAEPVRATAAGIQVLPNSSLRQLGGGSGGGRPVLQFDMRGSVTTQDLLRQMEAIAAETTSERLRSYDGQVGERARENLARRGS